MLRVVCSFVGDWSLDFCEWNSCVGHIEFLECGNKSVKIYISDDLTEKILDATQPDLPTEDVNIAEEGLQNEFENLEENNFGKF